MGDFGRKVDQFLDVFFNKGGMDSVLQGLQNTLIIAVSGLIIGVIAVVGIGGGAYYYFKFVRGKKKKDEDLDFFDDDGYEEEPYINEDEEPDIAEDDETQDEE